MSRAALLVLADGRFPAGGHAHSGGAEAGRHARDASRTPPPWRPSAGAGCTPRAWSPRRSPPRPRAGHDPLAAGRGRRRPYPRHPRCGPTARRLGRQLMRAARATWPTRRTRRAGRGPSPRRPPARRPRPGRPVRRACAPLDAAYAAAYENVSGPATAAVRLLSLDPFDATAVLARLAAELDQVARTGRRGRAAGRRRGSRRPARRLRAAARHHRRAARRLAGTPLRVLTAADDPAAARRRTHHRSRPCTSTTPRPSPQRHTYSAADRRHAAPDGEPPARPAHRPRRTGRLRQDRHRRRAVPGAARRAVHRRRHQRHLHPRGRRVPAPRGRAARRADHRRGDRRLPAHRHPRRHLRQPRSRRGPGGARSARSTWSWSSPAATTSPPPSPRAWSTPRSSSSTWRAATTSRARAAPASPPPTCSSSTRPTSPRTSAADLEGMARDAKAQRGELPVAFTSLKAEDGVRPCRTGCASGWRPGPRARHDPRTPTPAAPRADARSAAGLRATARIARADRRPTAPPAARPRRRRAARAAPHSARTATEAEVCVVGAMSAPLGGDRLRHRGHRRGGRRAAPRPPPPRPSRCPAARGEPARYDVRLTVGDGAGSHWLPEPLISARGQRPADDHHRRTGPHRPPGAARGTGPGPQRRGDRARCAAASPSAAPAGRCSTRRRRTGPAPRGWDGPAVLGGHRAVGQLLVVGPEFETKPAEVRLLGAAAGERSDGGAGQGVLAPLAGPGALATAVAPDALRLRRLLDEAAAAAAAG